MLVVHPVLADRVADAEHRSPEHLSSERLRMDHRFRLIGTGELLNGGPRLPHRGGDELDLFTVLSAKQICAGISLHSMDAGKDFLFEHLLVLIGILRLRVAVPDPHDHGVIPSSYRLKHSFQSLRSAKASLRREMT